VNCALQKNYRELQECFESLIRYGTALLRPEAERTPDWRTIRMSAVLCGIQVAKVVDTIFNDLLPAGVSYDWQFWELAADVNHEFSSIADVG
jgi:hypothetical protein